MLTPINGEWNTKLHFDPQTPAISLNPVYQKLLIHHCFQITNNVDVFSLVLANDACVYSLID